jgi:hypothetical protein
VGVDGPSEMVSEAVPDPHRMSNTLVAHIHTQFQFANNTCALSRTDARTYIGIFCTCTFPILAMINTLFGKRRNCLTDNRPTNMRRTGRLYKCNVDSAKSCHRTTGKFHGCLEHNVDHLEVSPIVEKSKKSESCNSLKCREVPTEKMFTNFGTAGVLPNIIIRSKFHVDQSRCAGFEGSKF